MPPAVTDQMARAALESIRQSCVAKGGVFAVYALKLRDPHPDVVEATRKAIEAALEARARAELAPPARPW